MNPFTGHPPRLLLCCDLDRTLIPNGAAEESPAARPLFREFVADPAICLAYISGRHLGLIDEAIKDYGLPVPNYAVGDVGTTIYSREDAAWSPVSEWWQDIARDWGGASRHEICACIGDILGLTLQPSDRQNTFKLSYFVALSHDIQPIMQLVRERLDEMGLRYSLVWSVDEVANVGLLDVLPERATKLHAMEFLMSLLDVDEKSAIFAGDSGNDIPVLSSGHQSVLVGNADETVMSAARRALSEQGRVNGLFVAESGFMGMNGNYAAGVLEGVHHYRPDLFPGVGGS